MSFTILQGVVKQAKASSNRRKKEMNHNISGTREVFKTVEASSANFLLLKKSKLRTK